MANSCEGTLRIRGPENNIKSFLLNGLEPHNDSKKIELQDENILFFSSCHIKGTERGQVSYVEVYFSEYEDTNVITVALEAKFIGIIKADELLNICQKYGIDMRIYGFERGTEVNQDIEIINGKITKNNLIKYDDYIWDCVSPERGG